MWRALTVLALAALCAAAPAAAGERVIASGDAFNVSAYRGWVMWNTEEGAVLWRDGVGRAFAPESAGPSGVLRARLGSDSKGRTAVVYLDCAKKAGDGNWKDCQVVQRVLATGAERNLLRVTGSSRANGPEISRGSLALSFGSVTDKTQSLRLYRPGRRALRLTEESPYTTDIERGRLVYAGHDRYAWPGWVTAARAIDLRGARPRLRTLAHHDGEDEDGRIGATVIFIGPGATDGRFGYWVRTANSQSGGAREIWRADLDDSKATAEKLTIGSDVDSIAVNAGRIYYTVYQRGLIELTDPAWQDSGLRTPVRI